MVAAARARPPQEWMKKSLPARQMQAETNTSQPRTIHAGGRRVRRKSKNAKLLSILVKIKTAACISIMVRTLL